VRVDKQVDFDWREDWRDGGVPYKDFSRHNYSVRWTGVIVPPVSGTYQLGIRSCTGFQVYLEDALLVDIKNMWYYLNYRYSSVNLKAGQPYRIKIDFHKFYDDADISLLWALPKVQTDKIGYRLC
jgi:beta-glucosidase